MNCHDLDEGSLGRVPCLKLQIMSSVSVGCACSLYVFRLLGGYSEASLYNGGLAKIECHPGRPRH